MVTYLVISAMGLMLLMLIPDSQVRWQRLASKGGAAMLFGLGVFGAAYSGMVA
ncbi:hypothetical protein OZN62_04330 [Aurantiacibacter sp. MUD11]|uniref:hypothetical protein n=1 Tax=Aurantiacibacter sp. MUD11 TaxID=3003265 RepID=UPI0022AA55E2|nr:hypothetical protein [Aurantiacibacter sp. MUD11]WAT18803.1 hypothetical protein OZN62_04330 [Aurantiacibacter sp. MUD11]